jgi:hypothetical protein
MWALIIGINNYTNTTPLFGAVRDAEMLKEYLELDLSVPPGHVRILTDADATRAAILSALYDLRDNPNIHRGDAILIHYAGHGASYDCPDKNGSIEALCPVDRGTENTDHEIVLDISDREINVFLTELSSAKGDNVTFVLDCCYAGGAARAEKEFRAREVPPLADSLEKMLLAADNNPRKQASGSVRAEHWTPDWSSHVVLAACQDYERAWECSDGNGGDFTIALLKALRFLPHHTSYRGLIEHIGRLRRQKPCAVGSHVDNPIFAHRLAGATPRPKGTTGHPEPASAPGSGVTGVLQWFGFGW